MENNLDNIKEKLRDILKELVDENCDIDDDMGFFNLGMTSLIVSSFCERIREVFDISCDEADIFNYPNIEELSEFISEKFY